MLTLAPSAQRAVGRFIKGAEEPNLLAALAGGLLLAVSTVSLGWGRPASLRA